MDISEKDGAKRADGFPYSEADYRKNYSSPWKGLCVQPIVNKARKRRRKRRVKKVKDASEWGVPEWRALLQGKEFTDDDDGARRVITDVVFSHEDDVY